MNRRLFITSLSGALAWPRMAIGQRSGKPPTVAILAPSRSLWLPWNAVFLKRLGELGWLDGSSVAIEYGWAEGKRERFAELAAEFARNNADVIVTFGSAVPAVKTVTSTIPIVFPMANDPVGGGIVASPARPGGNVTGISIQARDLAGKRLELLRELRPELRRLGVIADSGYREGALVIDDLESVARHLGIEVVRFGIRDAAEIPSVLGSLSHQVQALFVVISAVMAEGTGQINRFALMASVPTMYNTRDYVAAGGLISYGPNYPDLFRRTAEIVDKILRGANPADIPVEQPTRFDLVINLKTARALGLEILRPCSPAPTR